jgi:hypothetical protein
MRTEATAGRAKPFGMPYSSPDAIRATGREGGNGKSFQHFAQRLHERITTFPRFPALMPMPTAAQIHENPQEAAAMMFFSKSTPADMLNWPIKIARARAKQEGSPQAVSAMERVQVAYDALTYNKRSAYDRYTIATRTYDTITPDQPNVTLEPEETELVTLALHRIGVAHTLTPGANVIDLQPMQRKMKGSDPERDEISFHFQMLAAEAEIRKAAEQEEAAPIPIRRHRRTDTPKGT